MINRLIYKLSNILREHFWQLFRYGLVSLTTLAIFIMLNYFLVDILGLHPRYGYFIATTMGYIFIYFSSSRFTFGKKETLKSAKNFIIYIIVFWTLGNIFFNVVYSLTHWHYIVIIGLNIMIFFPIRFFTQKYIVFKDDVK